jgi:hypothetical protein
MHAAQAADGHWHREMIWAGQDVSPVPHHSGSVASIMKRASWVALEISVAFAV